MKPVVKNILLRSSMLLILVAVAALMICAKINRERTTVSAIDVKIDDMNDQFFVSKESVKTLVTTHFNCMGKTMSGTILRKIENRVESMPQIRDASAYMDDKGVLTIQVEQRMPVARVFSKSGESFYIDESGYKFPLSNSFSAKVPIITGNITESGQQVEKISTPNLKNAFEVEKQLKKDKTWSAMIGQINVNEKNELELVPRLGNAIVLLGAPENLELKMKKLGVFYTEVIGKQGWDKYKVINIMYKDQVVCLK